VGLRIFFTFLSCNRALSGVVRVRVEVSSTILEHSERFLSSVSKSCFLLAVFVDCFIVILQLFLAISGVIYPALASLIFSWLRLMASSGFGLSSTSPICCLLSSL